MRNIDVCLSPDLIGLYQLENRLVVVVDVLRATSCMVTAFANGVKQIQTFAQAELCLGMRKSGFIVAGERNGETIEGFDLGNSPLSYLNGRYSGETIAMTTTNGTVALEKAKSAKEIIIGAFLNLSAVSEYIKSRSEDVLILCAGWKGRVNLEDTLFAGALVHQLKNVCEHECDTPQLAETLYLSAKDDLTGYLSTSSHVKRLKRLNIQEDIEFCLTPNQYSVVPALSGEFILPVQQIIS